MGTYNYRSYLIEIEEENVDKLIQVTKDYYMNFTTGLCYDYIPEEFTEEEIRQVKGEKREVTWNWNSRCKFEKKLSYFVQNGKAYLKVEAQSDNGGTCGGLTFLFNEYGRFEDCIMKEYEEEVRKRMGEDNEKWSSIEKFMDFKIIRLLENDYA